MPNYHPEVVKLLNQYGCQRLEEAGRGMFYWYSKRTGVKFIVDHVVPSKGGANEILRRAGIGPLIK